MKPVHNVFQQSITEWFAQLGSSEKSEAFRREDNTKNDRLEILYQVAHIPYERPQTFPAAELATNTGAFAQLFRNHPDMICAIRLVPTVQGLPKLRFRGLTLKESYESWFRKQSIDPQYYKAEILPHSATLDWSFIFIVNDVMIFGEVIEGLHNQLSTGSTEHVLYQFIYDYNRWQWNIHHDSVQAQTQRILSIIHMTDPVVRDRLHKDLDMEFVHEYPKGYFEATVWPDGMSVYPVPPRKDLARLPGKPHIIDYNRMLGNVFTTAPLFERLDNDAIVRGARAMPGVARSRVVVVDEASLESVDFPNGSILVCDLTDVRYLPVMRRAAAIVTNRGGILSHAAIVSRELNIPCIVNTKNATKMLKRGDEVEVDAHRGIVRKL